MIGETYARHEICPATFLREFQALTDAEIARYRLFLGHMGFDQARRIGGKTVTILRDPVDRILSLFSYWKELGAAAGPGPSLVQVMSLEELLRSDEPAIVTDVVNAQTWQLAFDHSMESRLRHRNLGAEALLDKAKENLQRVNVVGLCEDMEGTRALLTSRLGLGSAGTVPVINKTTRRLSRSDLPPGLEDRIQSVVDIDVQLYQHARALFVDALNKCARDDAERRTLACG